MGAWGAKLYEDDEACDIRDTFKGLSKIPASGDRLLEILVANHGGSVEMEEDGGPTFWMAVADQFERRGIRCVQAFERALEAINSGADLKDLQERGMDEKGLSERRKVHLVLASRLRSPRPERKVRIGARPPALVVQTGEVYSFPTMDGDGFNAWFSSWDEARFVPNGWGAMLILATGRAYDWLPWCAVCSLTVDASNEPTLSNAEAASLYFIKGGSYVVPRKSHLNRMQMRLLGKLPLDAHKAAGAISKTYKPEFAVACGWSYVASAQAWPEGQHHGVAVSTLLAVS